MLHKQIANVYVKKKSIIGNSLRRYAYAAMCVCLGKDTSTGKKGRQEGEASVAFPSHLAVPIGACLLTAR